MRVPFGVVCLFAVASFVAADIPVHCLHKHVVGEWTFHRSKAGMKAGQISSCNKAHDYLGGGDYGLGEPNYDVENKVQVKLEAPNKASATINGVQKEGTWTMMYDEGFEVLLGDEKYFAFSKYTGSGKSTTSHCDKTFP